MTLIPFGVHTTAIPVLDPKPLQSPLRLIVVSRLAPNKRVDHSIQAMRCLVRDGIDAHLTIVGAGVVEQPLRRSVAELGLNKHIVFTGLLPEKDKDEAMRRAHLLLHTSMREGWGLNVIEANAMGTPAVVYPVPGLVESTLHDETGVVVSEETPEALASAV